MTYEKPCVLVIDKPAVEAAIKRVAVGGGCNCTGSGSKVCYGA